MLAFKTAISILGGKLLNNLFVILADPVDSCPSARILSLCGSNFNLKEDICQSLKICDLEVRTIDEW